MSTNILETETFSITRFFGGTPRGICYQISMAGSPGYVQLTKDDAELLRSTLAVELSSVPSEATPTKENTPPPMKDVVKVRVAQYEARIPCGNCGHVHLGRCSVCDPPGCEQIVPPIAPAPEVQGTPKSISAESASPLQLAAESTAPVGTPQKETPKP